MQLLINPILAQVLLNPDEGIGTVRVSTRLFTEKVVLYARLYDDKWVSDIYFLTC